MSAISAHVMCSKCPLRAMTRSNLCWACERSQFDGPILHPDRWKDRPVTPRKVDDPVLQIKIDTCAEFAISMTLLVSRRGRSRLVTRALRKAARRMRDELGMSYPEIGDELNRHHTTIMALLNKRYEVSHAARKEQRDMSVSGDNANK